MNNTHTELTTPSWRESWYMANEKFNPYPSLFNRLSGTILVLALICISAGCIKLLYWSPWGLLLVTLGIFIPVLGYIQPKETPKHNLILTLLGNKTTIVADHATLVLKPFVDAVEIDMSEQNMDFKLKKGILCRTGTPKGNADEESDQIGAYVYGSVSLTVRPDNEDDPPGTPEWMSGGEKLRNFDDAGRMEGIKKILDTMFTPWLEEIGKHHTIHWMETNSLALTGLLIPLITGASGIEDIKRRMPRVPHPDEDLASLKKIANSRFDDARGLGLKIDKFNVILAPDQEVMDARNRSAIEDAQRAAELKDARTRELKIIRRWNLSHNGQCNEKGELVIKPDEKPISMSEARRQVIEEELIDQGRSQLITGGKNVAAIVPPANEKGGGK